MLALAHFVVLSDEDKKTEYLTEVVTLPERYLYQASCDNVDFFQDDNLTHDRLLPPLASRSAYWRVTALTVALACQRPDVLGEFLWTNIPSARLLMLMIISGRFSAAIAQSALITSNTSLAAHPSYRFKDVDISLLESCAVVVRGNARQFSEAIEELEGELWDSLFVHRYKFRSQLQSLAHHKEVIEEINDDGDDDVVFVEEGAYLPYKGASLKCFVGEAEEPPPSSSNTEDPILIDDEGKHDCCLSPYVL
jgi:hypothetical protein